MTLHLSTTGSAAKTRSHGDRNRYLHGPDEHNTPGKGCRCTPCTRANNRAQEKRRAAIDTGTHVFMVDAEPVRAHVRALMGSGLAYQQIGRLAGISAKGMSRLLYGRSGTPARRVTPRNAQALMEVHVTHLPDDPTALVNAAGTQRRLQALAVLGWPAGVLAADVGMSRDPVKAIMQAPPGRRVTVATARKVRDLYDRLWDADPVRHGVRASDAKTIRGRAEAKGWAPSLAWDDDTIDDPDATPERGETGARYRALAEDAADLISQGVSVLKAAERLGVSKSYLELSIRRARPLPEPVPSAQP